MIKTRFAPSPTGYLHLGHAFSALFAARAGQIFTLRLEDIDPQRCKPDFVPALYEDLAWVGLSWPLPVRVQSAHFADYQKVLADLQGRGLLYPCFCTRADIAAAAGAPQAGDYGRRYNGRCKALSCDAVAARIAQGEAYALRLDVQKAALHLQAGRSWPLRFYDRRLGWQAVDVSALDDVVLARTLRGVEGVTGQPQQVLPASYHLCVTHDDAVEKVDLVTRGEDLLSSTSIHRLLQALLDWPTPEYHHHPLLCDAAGKRLAKRDNAPALRDLRAAGISASDLIEPLEPLLDKALHDVL